MKVKYCAMNFLLMGWLLLMAVSTSAFNDKIKIIEAETGETIGGASTLADAFASKGYLACLTRAGQALKFSNLPMAGKLAVRYTSLHAGTIGMVVNNQPGIKLNIHSSGDYTCSFLYSIIDVAIPEGASMTITLDSTDVALYIDQIIIGTGDFGLPPDIWNLPPLPIAAGPYSPDWKELEPDLYSSRMVARRQVRRMVALGSAIHA